MLILFVLAISLALPCKSSATDVACESNIPSHYCNPTQRNCFVDREYPLREPRKGCIPFTFNARSDDTFQERWKCYGCSRRVNMSEASQTRPANVTMERSAIRKGKYDLTVSWKDPNGSDSRHSGYEVRLKHKLQLASSRWIGSLRIGQSRVCECLLPNKTEFTFLNIDKRQEDEELVKVEVIRLPYHHLSPDCSTSTVTFFPARQPNEVLRNPQHCVHTPVSDVLTETSLISTPGGRHTGEMKLHLSWNNYQNTDNSKVFFVMVTDPLIDPKPSCRNHGSNPPCFVTNSTSVTIWPLNASRKYYIYVEAAMKCDALTTVEEYNGCGECCNKVEVLPLLTRLPSPNPTPTAGPFVETDEATALHIPLGSPLSNQQKSAAVYYSRSIDTIPVTMVPAASGPVHASTDSSLLLRTSYAQAHSASTDTSSSIRVSPLTVSAGVLPVAVDAENYAELQQSSQGAIVGPLVGSLVPVTVILLVVVVVVIIIVRRRSSSKPQEENNFNGFTIAPDEFKKPNTLPPVKKIVLRLSSQNPIPSNPTFQPPTQCEMPSDTPTSQIDNLDETETSSSDDTSTLPTTCNSPCLARASDHALMMIQPSSDITVHRGPPVNPYLDGSPPVTPYLNGSPPVMPSFARHSAFVIFSSKTPKKETEAIEQHLINDLSSKYGIYVTPSEMGRGNLPKWVESECRNATTVLCVCNKEFFEEWEQSNTVIHCLSHQVYAAANEVGRKHEKFTVVLLKQSHRQFIPSSYLMDLRAFLVTEVHEIASYIKKVPPYAISTSSP